MIDPTHALPIKQQAEARGIRRSSVCYKPRPILVEDLWLMRRNDELHLNYPFAGNPMQRDLLGQHGLAVGRRHLRALMRRMRPVRNPVLPDTLNSGPEQIWLYSL